MIVLLQLGQWIIGKILGRIPMAIKDKFVAEELTITLSWRIVALGGKVDKDFQLRIRHERTISRLQSLRRLRATAKPRSAASFSGNQLDPSLISTAMEPSQSSLPWGRRLLSAMF